MSNPIRCPACDRFIGKESIKIGRVEIKCPNCKAWIIIIAKQKDATTTLHN